ncbi:Biotin carboxyl carrier protein of acetyl-CoA carboxylase [Planktothrix agardhii]|jgi:biotin carboxyl carrier protein|uniref:Biotin carboxyl carrier protein of acetyl-CoA carboxylase n=1 Tax=Planktothrix agardhii TaxID=1160 RepID=A0AAD1Q3H7_PLAAG|nr:Biotin carboxyl carrier protein of acetyl-CoA carboxylase [Planktothrix agardhii]
MYFQTLFAPGFRGTPPYRFLSQIIEDCYIWLQLGDRISTGQSVCIIEAMKLMNEIEAEFSGQVMEILIQNGSPVEYGQPLIKIKPD